ncbi:MAG TPA: Uma2 family endonuclease [Streptosporangiaceae bacterium]
MSVAAVAHYTLPDTPYNLWVRDELVDYLRLPNDGSKAEVIGGEIVVSPGPDYAHNDMVQDVVHSISAARIADPSFRWRCIHTMDLDLSEIQDGYIPDLAVLDRETAKEARKARLKDITPEQVALVLEITSPSTAGNDRMPTARRSTATKWNGYAQVGIPYYLLIDRAPRSGRSTLYSNPDRSSGAYMDALTWDFGETIRLPEPFGFDIPTDEWEPW